VTGTGLLELQVHVIETPAGVFIIDAKGKVLDKILFSKIPHVAAAELKQVQEGVMSSVLQMLKKSGQSAELVFEDTALANAAEKDGLKVSIERSSTAEEFRNKLSSDWKGRDGWLKEQELDTPVLRSPSSYNEFARQVTLEIARAGIASAATRRDLSAVQAVRAVDDIDKTLNLLAGRVREWYGLHFPEMDRIVEKHDTYARLVAKLGNRNNFTKDNLAAEGLPSETVDQLSNEIGRAHV
jgi:nucleolar protein 56